MTYPSAITAVLLDYDASTVITGALDEAFDISFMDELNGPGFGAVSLALSDPDADQLLSGRYVQIKTNTIACFTFKIEGHPEYHQIDQGEQVAQFLTAQGRGWGCVFDEAITQPEPLLVGVDLDTSWRIWSFAAINFTNSWNPAVETYEYFDGITYGARVDSVKDTGVDPDDPSDDVTKLYPAPIGFPWPNAPKNGNGFAPTAAYDPMYWVIADGAPSEESIGFHFFRGGFTLAGPQAVAFHATGDNLWTLFLDGVPILGEADDTLIWKGWKEVTLELPTGFHTVAFVVENVDADVDYNPAGALFDAVAVAVYPGDVETTLTLSLLTSGATDLVESFFSATEWPGWTPGAIIIDWYTEVQARGALQQFAGDSFSGTVDTGADAWDNADPTSSSAFIPSFSLRIGATGLDLLNQLVEEGWISYHFQPDTPLTLDAWAGSSTIGTVTSEAFAEGVNVLGLERGQTKPYANALLVQWAKGNVWVEDTGEITAYGSRVEDLYATDAATLADAERLGRVELARRVIGAQSAILITVEPRDTTEAPYEGFGIGDYVSVPDLDGDPTSVQVLSIAAQQGDDGFATWRMECNARWRSPAQEATDLLRSIGGKSLGSAAEHGVPKD